MKNSGILLGFLFTVAVANSYSIKRNNRADCIEDFSPCSCQQEEGNLVTVECNQVAFEDVLTAFERTNTNQLIRFSLNISPDDTPSIPKNLLGTNQADQIYINCPSRSDSHLQIDENAFVYSSPVASAVQIENCQIDELNFLFLAGFQSLTDLSITHSTFPVTFETLPLLPSLHALTISGCTNFQNWIAPNDISSVRELRLDDNLLGEENLATILNYFLASNIEIEGLFIDSNSLTSVPDIAFSFENLHSLSISGNTIPVLPSGSLIFNVPEVFYLGLENLSLDTIESDAFQGNFGPAEIRLGSNNLNKLDSSIFESILHDMADSTGQLVLSSNPIECDCDLSWLVRDSRDLLAVVSGGTCSDSTPFEDLNPEDFYDCEPVIVTTEGPSPTSSTASTTTSTESTTSTVTVTSTITSTEKTESTISSTTTEGTGCSEDFSPCTCEKEGTNAIRVECIDASFDDIKSAFSTSTTNKLIRLYVTIPPEETPNVPDNLLGTNQAEEIYLTCSSNADSHLLVSENAFVYSSPVATAVQIENCQIDELNFLFLAGFQSLTDLSITHSTFPVTFDTLPLLPSLHALSISGCTNFQNWITPNDISSVRELRLDDNLLGEANLGTILNYFLMSNIDIEDLSLNNNSLSRVPDIAFSFENLHSLSISSNNIPVLSSGSLAFSAPQVDYVGLENLSLDIIEEGAFEGNFAPAEVNLKNNNLAVLDSSVFKSILEDMTYSTGFIDISSNPFTCDCGLSWLIRDNRDLLAVVSGGTCVDSTPFEDLIPEDFNDCDSATTATPEITTEAVTATTEEASTSTSTSLETTQSTTLEPSTGNSTVTATTPTTKEPTTSEPSRAASLYLNSSIDFMVATIIVAISSIFF